MAKEIKLNEAQAHAVNQVYGPLLVLAGPGTGKTQLLSARVARILQDTDALASNVLCLTFTEKGAANMLERMTSLIGRDAYEVNISTYHAFGGELIRAYSEYFIQTKMENPIDELGQHEIIAQLHNDLNYTNPLKTTKISSILGAIGEVKQALLTSNDIVKIAEENSQLLSNANPKISAIFDSMSKMPSKVEKALPYFKKTYELLQQLAPKSPINPKYGSLATSAITSLSLAINNAEMDQTTKPLTAWKNDWLSKNVRDKFSLSGNLANQKLACLADVMTDYQKVLEHNNLFDFNDMILKTIAALEKYDDLRFTLQEKYQFILLDEYQDTNPAQAKLVQLLTNNPVNEGRPNVMAVGDDDQAIFTFQGAEASNMSDFADSYRDTVIVNLTENYRSHPDILTTAANVAGQIENRISMSFAGITKQLVAKAKVSESTIIRREFLSPAAERNWVAKQIEQLITKQNIKPSEIAVLAPKHKYLEPLVPFLNNLQIPVRYEKRENILEAPIIDQLITMSRLVLALAAHNEILAASYWPKVLSYDFWQIPTEDIWQISWEEDKNWTRKLGASKYRWIALFFMQLARITESEGLETMLDYLSGGSKLKIKDEKITSATSPLKKYYTSSVMERQHPDIFYQTISHLTVLRQKLRDRQASSEKPLRLSDLIKLVDLYSSAEVLMTNTSPYNQASDSVQLMTVFKAKGLEFEHVFLLSCENEVWGPKAPSGGIDVPLPKNLAPIRRAGTSEDERLRILFVAITRAKSGLYMTSAKQSFSGKPTTYLKFFDEVEQEDGSVVSRFLPKKFQAVTRLEQTVPSLDTLQTNWQTRHVENISTSLKDLLAERVINYQLSPTHLNTFIDLERAGPQSFLINSLLKFPQAPSGASDYGTAIHDTLEWYQQQINGHKKPTTKQAVEYLTQELISKNLDSEETKKRIKQGEHELPQFLANSTFKPGDKPEEKFEKAGVFVGEAHLNGKIDKLEIDQANKSLVIVDYKTGSPETKWNSSLKLHKYKQQLYIYKLLVEGSSAWRGWRVANERLDFIKPDPVEGIVSLELNFKQKELDDIKVLVGSVYHHIKNLNFPDISQYPKTAAGSREFERDLIAGKI